MKYTYLTMLVILTSCFNCKKYYLNRFKPLEIKGVVDTFYIDYKNHGAETIILDKNDKSGIVESWILGLYSHCSKGDSIYKAKGSLAVYLYKKDTTMVFYPVCDGDTLK